MLNRGSTVATVGENVDEDVFLPAVAVGGDVSSRQALPQLADEDSLRKTLAAHVSAGRFSLHAMLGLHASFLAGAVPVLMGIRGYELLSAYASAVAGGRLHWIPVAHSTMEPQDLLGRFDARAARIVPSATGLLDVVRDATTSGRLHVVVLEGFNRAPTEGYLSPILNAAQATRLGDDAREDLLGNSRAAS